MDDLFVIVAAAGSGVRLGAGVPKAFVRIGARCLLDIALCELHRQGIENVTVALPPGTIQLPFAPPAGMSVGLVEGGRRRQDSVFNAAQSLTDDSKVIFIHDAARPFLREGIAVKLYEAALQHGAAAAAIPAADTLKTAVDGRIVRTIDRQGVYRIQTPQAFEASLFRKMLSVYGERNVTDDCALAETLGVEPHIVSGSQFTFKITTQEDLQLAQLIAFARGWE